MRLLPWIPRWAIVVMLLAHFLADAHMLHYLHLKKFLTAVAFARALGKRPTILPIPVPIPIPIAQNEVIKVPIGGGGKTMILDGHNNKGGGNKGGGLSHLLGSGSPAIDFTGSSAYGYSMPGIGNLGGINLKGSDSQVINLASALGSGSGSPRIIVLGGQNNGNPMISGNGPTIIRLNDLGSPNIQLGTGGMNLGLANNLGFGGNGLMSGDLESAFSVKYPNVFQRPLNLYADKPRRKFPVKFRGRRTFHNRPGPEFHNHKYSDKTYDNRHISSQEEHQTQHSYTQGNHKKPIPVGEKFTYRP